MTDDTVNLVLEHLKRIQGDMSSMKEDMHLMRMEMTAMRHDLASVRTLQDVHSTEIGSLKSRMDRIERRLDLTD
ncbi:MAG: hypothetical protein AAGH82_06070 [Pseudomonadota bacterium]